MTGTQENALTLDLKEISLIIDSLQKQVISNRGVSIKVHSYGSYGYCCIGSR